MPDLHAKRLIRQDDSADDGGSELEEFCAVAHDLAEVAFPNGAGLSGGVALWLMGNTAPAYLGMRRSCACGAAPRLRRRRKKRSSPPSKPSGANAGD